MARAEIPEAKRPAHMAPRRRRQDWNPIYTAEQLWFMQAMHRFKERVPFPSHSELLAELKRLGFRLIATEAPVPKQAIPRPRRT